MRRWQELRLVLQLVAGSVFCYQAYTAFNKYSSNLTVTSVVTKEFRFLPEVAVMICPKDQFNYTEALRKGYSSNKMFLGGDLPNGLTSWNGLQNQTFKQLIEAVYQADFEGIRLEPDLAWSEDFTYYEGHCRVIHKARKLRNLRIFIKSGSAYNVYVFGKSNTINCGIPSAYCTGELIEYKSTERGPKMYTINFELEHQNAAAVNCGKYGLHRAHNSQSDCVEHFLAKQCLSRDGNL